MMMKRILLLCFLVLSVLSVSARKQKTNVASINVMSFNIRFNSDKDSLDTAWDVRRGACGKMFNEYKPDVIGMQEPRYVMWQQIYDLLPEYGHYKIETNDTIGERQVGDILLLYRLDKYELLNSGHFWLSATPYKPSTPWNSTDTHVRAALWLHLKDKATKKDFYMVTTHFPYKKAPIDTKVRAQCCELINAKMKSIAGDKATIFVTGDMNASHNLTDSRRASIDPFYDWFQGARETAPITDNRSSFNGFGRVDPKIQGKNLDHIFYRNATPKEFQTIDKRAYGVRWISDHYPIMCSFTF